MAQVSGKTVEIGDYVCFKSDVEQGGTISKIERNQMGSIQLVLTSEFGFYGDYKGAFGRPIDPDHVEIV